MTQQSFTTVISFAALVLTLIAATACQSSQPPPTATPLPPVTPLLQFGLPTPLTVVPASQPTPASADPVTTARAGFNVSGWT